jgi:hypothetical protein
VASRISITSIKRKEVNMFVSLSTPDGKVLFEYMSEPTQCDFHVCEDCKEDVKQFKAQLAEDK